MRFWVCLPAVIFLAACRQPLSEQIVGEWTGKEGGADITYSFNPDSTFSMMAMTGHTSETMIGRYQASDDGHLEFFIESYETQPASIKTEGFESGSEGFATYRISRDTLSLIPPVGPISTFTRRQ